MHQKHRVAIIGLGRLGQVYADIYSAIPQVELVAFVETHPERLKWAGEKYGIDALYTDTEALLRELVPDIASVVTPTRNYAEPVVACAEAGVRGISTLTAPINWAGTVLSHPPSKTTPSIG